ncbi:MAG TPA: hypothetical protein VJM10_05515 [Candidatus Methylomirabilis sp.]|nr:hypothetical protein [Candidatus Methylomirabilis sp.]
MEHFVALSPLLLLVYMRVQFLHSIRLAAVTVRAVHAALPLSGPTSDMERRDCLLTYTAPESSPSSSYSPGFLMRFEPRRYDA